MALSRRTLLTFTGTAVLGGASGLLTGQSALAASANRVLASSFGFDPMDSTAALQAALDSSADVVIVDNVGQDWITRPLFVRRDNVTVIFESGVTLRAKIGGFPAKRDSLLLVDGRNNVRIYGYGATFKMNKPEYTGEWKCCLRVHASTNVTVEGLVLRDADGDGLLVGKSLTDETLPPYSSNVTFRNVICDNNKRNGMSIISVDGLLVEGCAFINTKGTAPEAGVDFEPDLPTGRIANVVVRDSIAAGNAKLGWITNVSTLNASSTPVSILFERIVAGPVPVASFGTQGPRDTDPGGTVVLRDSLIDCTGSAAATWIAHAVPYTGLHTEFTNVTWWNTGNATKTNPLFMLSSGLKIILDKYGNARWNNAQVFMDHQAHLIGVEEGVGTNGLADVHGNFTVVSPYPVTTNFGVNPTDVNLDIHAHTSVPATQVGAYVGAPRVRMGDTTTVTIRRHGTDVSRPLAVAYHCAGSAKQRYHYHGVPGVAVIPAGSRSTDVPIVTRIVRGESENPVIVFAIDLGPSYSIKPMPLTSIEILRT